MEEHPAHPKTFIGLIGKSSQKTLDSAGMS